MAAESPVVVLVGHCGPDESLLRSAVRAVAPKAVFMSAVDDESLYASLESADLVLVNRVLDGAFEDHDGVKLVGRLASGGAAVMLVSEVAEAQTRAVESGAAPGFGKRSLHASSTREALSRALGARSA